jgi:hypothetical protein
MLGGIADLVHADHHQPVKAPAVELVGHDAGEDLADRAPADPHQLGDRRLGHLLRKERHNILEVARVRRARPRPWHRLVDIAAARAVQPSQQALDVAAASGEIELPPALVAVLLDRKAASSTTRADRPLVRPQSDGHDHPLSAKRTVPDRCPREPEHPLECRSDPHVVLLRRLLNFRHPAACRRGRRRVTMLCANCGRELRRQESAPQQATPRRRASQFTPRSTGEPHFPSVSGARPRAPGHLSHTWSTARHRRLSGPRDCPD